jgi:hypothetical protein
MNTLYMARRQVYPEQIITLGPFSNREAALACAEDSLYPECAQVMALDIASIPSGYEPQSSYPDWARQEAITYYGFQASYCPIPQNLTKELSSELADIETFAPECFTQPRAEVSESMMIAGLVTGMDRAYQCMHVIWTENETVITALSLAGVFSRLVRARGYADRRALLDFLEVTIRIREDPYQYGDVEGELYDAMTNQFWRRFVIDHSSPPAYDAERWNF